jgi:hypothetical protein
MAATKRFPRMHRGGSSFTRRKKGKKPSIKDAMTGLVSSMRMERDLDVLALPVAPVD